MREPVLLALGAVVAFALQLILAPSISILGAMPNFALVYVGIVAMLRQQDSVIVMAFLEGLAFDLAGNFVLGAMAALLTLVAFLAGRVSALLGNNTVTVSLFISMVASLIVEVCYALLYVAMAGVPVFDAVVLRALPCALYDCALALIVLPLLHRMFAAAAPSHKAPTSSTIRLR